MKIVINIPKAFENHFNYDRFEDSLERIKFSILDGTSLCGNYEVETMDMLIKALKESTKLQEGQWLDDCGGVKCSCCGYRIDDDFYVKNYCTNCGSRMEVEE